MKDLVEKYLNKIITIRLEGLRIECKVLNVRKSYGNVDLNVTPVSGSSDIWVRESRIAC